MVALIIAKTSSAVSATTHGGPGAVALRRDRAAGRRGADCHSLLRVPVAFRGELPPDHLSDEIVLDTQELHHLGSGGDRVGRWLSGVAPLACHHKPADTDRNQTR
jgi:hypothetical protein